MVKINSFYKIRWYEKFILALEPKFHGDGCKNGHVTRKKSQNTLKSQQDVVKIFCFFSLSGLFIGVLRVPGEKYWQNKTFEVERSLGEV